MIKRLIAGAASLALTLGGVALAAAPAQALTGAACDDGDAWSWSVANPARYQAGPHEAVLGFVRGDPHCHHQGAYRLHG
jgi:hypothetical protein